MADEEAERHKREAQERDDELRRVPLQTIDKSKWPTNVRPIAIGETSGLGIDPDGRLYWNGKPVEIIGRRLDLTKWQNFIAITVAVFTGIAALATSVQAWTAYHDWACKTQVHWPVFKCPPESPLRIWGE
jgi:hypothetical protein